MKRVNHYFLNCIQAGLGISNFFKNCRIFTNYVFWKDNRMVLIIFSLGCSNCVQNAIHRINDSPADSCFIHIFILNAGPKGFQCFRETGPWRVSFRLPGPQNLLASPERKGEGRGGGGGWGAQKGFNQRLYCLQHNYVISRNSLNRPSHSWTK